MQYLLTSILVFLGSLQKSPRLPARPALFLADTYTPKSGGPWFVGQPGTIKKAVVFRGSFVVQVIRTFNLVKSIESYRNSWKSQEHDEKSKEFSGNPWKPKDLYIKFHGHM